MGSDYAFLSTPSARRATREPDAGVVQRGISIHALREEGDAPASSLPSTPSNFYPRPPRGGRRFTFGGGDGTLCISIHALREEGDIDDVSVEDAAQIFLSTPSARRATKSKRTESKAEYVFLSTPSARRATRWPGYSQPERLFLSTPSARRATPAAAQGVGHHRDFYPRPPRGGRRDPARRRCPQI